MEKEYQITSVIPIFGVEKYLSKCLNSIISQYIPELNLEIVAVDDGSIDNSGIIAEEYTLLNNSLVLVHQENRWLSGARNTGILLSSGEYISFIDSDDHLCHEAYQLLYKTAKKTQAEIIQFDYYHQSLTGEILDQSIFSPALIPNFLYFHDDILKNILPIFIRSHLLNGAPFRFYKSSFFTRTNFLFRENTRYAEDYLSCLDWFPYYHSYYYLPVPLYYYLTNPTSIMNAYNSKRIGQLVDLFIERENFMDRLFLHSQNNDLQSAQLLLRMVIERLFDFYSTINLTNLLSKFKELKSIINSEQLTLAAIRISNKQQSWGKVSWLTINKLKKKNYFGLFLFGCAWKLKIRLLGK